MGEQKTPAFRRGGDGLGGVQQLPQGRGQARPGERIELHTDAVGEA